MKKFRLVVLLLVTTGVLSGCFIAATAFLAFIGLLGAGEISLVGVLVQDAYTHHGNGYLFTSFAMAYGLLAASMSAALFPLGFFGILLLDPIIVQVPTNVTNVTATYDCGANGSGNLIITEMTEVPVGPGVTVTPEAGQKFIRFDVPTNGITTPASCDFDVNFDTGSQTDLEFKPMMTAQVTAGSNTYYAPFLPCMNNGGTLASVPAITIQAAGSLQQVVVPSAYETLGCSYPDAFNFGGGSSPVPALGAYGLAGLSAGLVGFGAYRIRRRRKAAKQK